MNIIFQDKLTLEEYLEAHQIIHGQERPRKETAQAVFGVAILAYIIGQFSLGIAIAVFFLMSGLILFPTLKRRRGIKMFMRSQEHSASGEVEIRKDGILISGQNRTSFFEWTTFKKHYKGTKIIMLFDEAGLSFSIPYRAFPTEVEKQRFADLLSDLIPDRFEPTKI